jgi:hypothetical protein
MEYVDWPLAGCATHHQTDARMCPTDVGSQKRLSRRRPGRTGIA